MNVHRSKLALAIRRARTRASAGFTLVELLVVVAIVVVLAAIAVPAFTRDDSEADFKRLMRQIAQDLRRAHYEAISSREQRSLIVPAGGTRYELHAVVPGTATMALLKTAQVPPGMLIRGVIKGAAIPGSSHSPPGSLPAEIRFSGTGNVQVDAPAPRVDSSATIYVETSDSRYQGRIVVYQTTAYSRIYDGWRTN